MLALPNNLLFAQDDDPVSFLRIIIGFIVVLFWLFNLFREAVKNKKAENNPLENEEDFWGEEPEEPFEKNNLEIEPVQEEIAAFIHRATNKEPQNQPPQKNANDPFYTPSVQSPKKERQFTQKSRKKIDETLISQSVSPKSIQQRFGHDLLNVDQQFNADLNNKFNHEISSFNQQDSSDSVYKNSLFSAAQIQDSLTNPELVKQAIVIAEVLRPPEDRWKE